MKFFAYLVALLIFHSTYGQHSSLQISAVHTYSDAEQFIKQNPSLKGEIITISSLDPEENPETKITALAKGETITIGENTYKVISTDNHLCVRSSYIYMDGNKLSESYMDSIRDVVEIRFKNGADFNQLVAEYSMDGMKDGDLGWAQEGVLLTEIEEAIKSHKVKDFFVVYVQLKKWYFIVLKTFDEKYVTESIVLKFKSVD
jgi:hypothetical protein